MMMMHNGTRLTSLLLGYLLVMATGGPLSRVVGIATAATMDEMRVCTAAADAACSIPRGGAAEKVLHSFLKSTEPIAPFKVQGWRWQTMSVLHEAGRLRKLVLKWQGSTESPENMKKLKDVTNYVVDFNMKGLHKVEKDLVFPWMRKELKEKFEDMKVYQAYDIILSQLESDRKIVAKLGTDLTDAASIAADMKASENARSTAIKSMVTTTAAFTEVVSSMLDRKNTLLGPTIARLVPEKEQRVFNLKAIQSLGIWDSRLHLVGMNEAVEATNDKAERKLFEEGVPSLARNVIPRFKRNLYDPILSVVDEA